MAKGFDNNEADFISGLSSKTGIDPRVIAAWVYQEGAFKQGGTGGFNYLNLKATAEDGHVGVTSNGFAQFQNVNDAVDATVASLNGTQNRIILNTAKTHPTPLVQIRAIAASPWDQNGYGPGGYNLIKTFTTLFTTQGLTDRYQGPESAKAVASTVETGSAADWTSIDMTPITNAAGSAASAYGQGVGDVAHAISYPFEWLSNFLGNNWDRFLWVIAGGVLVIIGAYMLFKSQVSATA